MKSLLQKRTIVLSKEDFIVAITKENPLFKEFSSDAVSKFQAIGKNKIRMFILQSYKRYLTILFGVHEIFFCNGLQGF